MAAELSCTSQVDLREPGDVGDWLINLGRKVALDDLTPGLMGAAMRWLRDHDSGFEWLVQVKDRLLVTGGLSMHEVTGVLNCWRAELLHLQRSGQAVDLRSVPPGRYAVMRPDGHVVFYQVETGGGRWAGYTFLQQVVGGGRLQYLGRVPPGRLYYGGRRIDLAEIARDPEAGARLFGRELGICAVCGRSLTDDVSRTAGIGPRCALRFARMRLTPSSGRRRARPHAGVRARRRLRELKRRPAPPGLVGPALPVLRQIPTDPGVA